MKVFLECKDLMLQKTMELFLKDYLSSKKECDFIVCDSKLSYAKPQFIIGDKAFLTLPFSKDKLLDALAEFYSIISTKSQSSANPKLEAKIDKILAEFKASLLEILNEQNQRK